MTKKALVAEIVATLKKMNIPKNGYVNIYSLPNVTWVGYTRVLLRKHIKGALYRNHQARLYSAEVSISDLCSINEELKAKMRVGVW